MYIMDYCNIKRMWFVSNESGSRIEWFFTEQMAERFYNTLGM